MANKRRIKENTPAARPKRRWLNIGPGIVLALAISAFIGARWISDNKVHQNPSSPPIIERQVISSSFEDKSGPTPEARFVIDRAAELSLTPDQSAKLRKLQSDWEKFSGPKMIEAKAAAKKTEDYLDKIKDRPRVPAAQIQNSAAPVVSLSREISSARQSYWDQAVKILTPDQRKTIQKEREADWAAKVAALSKKIRGN